MPHCVPRNAPPTIFSLKHTLIRSMATPNTPGMLISMHNASSKKACRGDLSEICPTMPSCRVTRPKCGMISQKSGHRSTSLLQSHRQPPVFDAKYPLTSKNSSPMLHPWKSNVLSIGMIRPLHGHRYFPPSWATLIGFSLIIPRRVPTFHMRARIKLVPTVRRVPRRQ